MPKQSKWTKEVPYESGLYWVWRRGVTGVRVVDIHWIVGKCYTISYQGDMVEFDAFGSRPTGTVWWKGPIELPDRPGKKKQEQTP